MTKDTPPPASRAAWQALVDLTGPIPRAPELEVDWDEVIDLALRHKSVLLLARGLGNMPDLEVPDQARQRLSEVSTERALLALEIARTTAVLALTFQETDISASVMKGAPLSQILYGDAAARDIGDIDFLIPPNQVAQAAEILEDLGYVSEFGGLLKSDRQRDRLLRYANQIQFVEQSSGRTVELQWRWQKFAWMMPTVPDRVWCQSMPLAGAGTVLVPDCIELFIYLCAHGLMHGWTRLKWLNDIRWCLHTGRLVQDDWAGVAKRADEIGMSMAVATAINVAARMDNAPVPRPLDDLISQVPKSKVLSEQSLNRMMQTALLRQDPQSPRDPFDLIRQFFWQGEVSVKGHPRRLAALTHALVAPNPRALAVMDFPKGLGAVYSVIHAVHMLRRLLPMSTGRREATAETGAKSL